MNKKSFFAVLSFLIASHCNGQAIRNSTFAEEFQSIHTSPVVIRFTNNLMVNNEGGHLQGIQGIVKKKETYAVISGSSDSFSYFLVVKMGNGNKAVSVNKLMNKPYKHAGGFQLYNSYMAIGVEDNVKKDQSKIAIYDLIDPEHPPVKPVAVITRKGKPFRATAGCVGFTRYKNKALLVAGDWDAKNLDFYSCDFDSLARDAFELIFTVEPGKLPKEGWIDNSWLPYQNINLFAPSDHELYLIGLGQNTQNDNMADLYALKQVSQDSFSIEKTASKIFHCTKGTSFKAGAGVVRNAEGKLGIFSCGYHIGKVSYLNYFDDSSLKKQTPSIKMK